MLQSVLRAIMAILLSMKAHLKKFAKTLPHPLLMRLHYQRLVRQKSALARALAAKEGLGSAAELDLRPYKTSDTVFLLGSGSSINQISDRQWQTIQQHDTIGFNFWPVHPFIPRIFVFESVAEVRQKGLFSKFLSLLNSRADAYAHVPKIVTEAKKLELRQIATELIPEFKKNLYVGYTVSIVARAENELEAGLKFLAGKDYFAPDYKAGRLFKYGGSVIAVISLALKMNYRRIVLCGIDLGDSHYFYQDAARYPETAEWEFIPKTDVHLTARKLPWMMPSQEVIYTFKRVILDPKAVELSVLNRNSTLFPRIPVLPEEFFN